MKECYFDLDTRVIADLILPGTLGLPRALITRINVPEPLRGRGLGTKILSEILADADAEGVVLELHPFSSGHFTDDELRAWYSRHGFVTQPDRTMHRQPGTCASAEARSPRRCSPPSP